MYGDVRQCIKCGMNADIVEKGKDYCAECWFKYFSGESIEEYEKRVKQLDQARKDKYEIDNLYKQVSKFLVIEQEKVKVNIEVKDHL